jgi:hypothetical protein
MKNVFYSWGLTKNILLILKELSFFWWGLEPPMDNTCIRHCLEGRGSKISYYNLLY